MTPVRRSRVIAALLGSAVVAVLATGCTGVPQPNASTTSPAAQSAGPSPSPSATLTLGAFPLGPATSTTALPADLPQGCRDILSAAVLAELDGVPLNAEGMGGGLRADSSRVCVWGDPGAVTTKLVTVLGYSPEREARDALYELAGEGFTCYEPQGGVRCEKTWESPNLPVTEGRTLFYRDGVIIDTQYSNLAPAGYTDAIIAALWSGKAVTTTPAPSPSPSR